MEPESNMPEPTPASADDAEATPPPGPTLEEAQRQISGQVQTARQSLRRAGRLDENYWENAARPPSLLRELGGGLWALISGPFNRYADKRRRQRVPWKRGHRERPLPRILIPLSVVMLILLAVQTPFTLGYFHELRAKGVAVAGPVRPPAPDTEPEPAAEPEAEPPLLRRIDPFAPKSDDAEGDRPAPPPESIPGADPRSTLPPSGIVTTNSLVPDVPRPAVEPEGVPGPPSEPQAPPEPEEPEVPVRLAGVMEFGDTLMAVVEWKGVVSYAHVGDVVGDGQFIVAEIQAERVVLDDRRNGERIALALQGAE